MTPMTDVYSRLRPGQSQSSFYKADLSSQNAADLSAPPITKEEFLPATPSLSLSITTTMPMDIKIKPEPDLKLEEDASPSHLPTLMADTPDQIFKASCSPTEPPTAPDGPKSKSSTPPIPTGTKASRKAATAAAAIQLIGDLPIAREEAVSTFNEIYDNNYQYKTLGRSREILESMTCDCTYEHGVDNEDEACGPYSNCINRLTQVECLEDDCRCRRYCQNQRFQRKEYADIEIVLTEKKGYGLRAEEDLPRDTFIYEYVGDVVNPTSFKKRMREYADEGIRHFYFMMLQKDEFIDATKSGGVGRFANHSCNPNCYVAKWTIGTHVRMGIFAKRDIRKHEELTFNYNVDRYGHQAQECFCGEPMCVGYIGGKTQTDIVTMDDLYLDALGITDEDDLMELKGTKKKKGKKIDDPDFMPTMKAISEKEVPKVVQAIRQTPSRKVLSKLLTRIKITEDQAALREIMRLRGYSLMTNVLQDYPNDTELITLVLESMKSWPLLNRNKVIDSKVHVPVEACAALEDESIKTLAQSLLDHWESLPTYSRIPKRAITKEDLIAMSKDEFKHKVTITPDPRTKIVKIESEENGFVRRKRRIFVPAEDYVPPHVQAANDYDSPARVLERVMDLQRSQAKDASVKALIAQVAAAAAEREEAAVAAAAEEKKKAEALKEKSERRKERAAQKKNLSKEDKEANKEKRLMKLVGAVVVKCMSKHSKQFDRDSFKKHARELTQIISEKEKKSTSYRDGKLDSLSEEKQVKIKKFAKEYIAKVIRKMEKSSKRQYGSSASMSASTAHNTPSTSMDTPNSNDGGESHPMGENSMSLEEAMGIDLQSDDSDDDNSDDDMEIEPPPSAGAMLPPQIPLRMAEQYPERDDELMDMDDVQPSSDPRRRHLMDIQ